MYTGVDLPKIVRVVESGQCVNVRPYNRLNCATTKRSVKIERTCLEMIAAKLQGGL